MHHVTGLAHSLSAGYLSLCFEARLSCKYLPCCWFLRACVRVCVSIVVMTLRVTLLLCGWQLVHVCLGVVNRKATGNETGLLWNNLTNNLAKLPISRWHLLAVFYSLTTVICVDAWHPNTLCNVHEKGELTQSCAMRASSLLLGVYKLDCFYCDCWKKPNAVISTLLMPLYFGKSLRSDVHKPFLLCIFFNRIILMDPTFKLTSVTDSVA